MKQFLQSIVAGVVAGFIVGLLMAYGILLFLRAEFDYRNDELETYKTIVESVKYELDDIKEALGYGE